MLLTKIFSCVLLLPCASQSVWLDTESPVLSCSHSVAIWNQQSCSADCERRCALLAGSERSWSLADDDETASCFDDLVHCIVPVGYKTSLTPTQTEERSIHTDIWDYDRFYDRESNKHRGRWFGGTRLKYHSYQQILRFAKESWSPALVDPRRVVWAALRVTGRQLIGDDRMCAYVEFSHRDEIESTYAPGIPYPPINDWSPVQLRGMNLGHTRDGAYSAHMANRIDLAPVEPHTYYSPSIVALIQQWYMATSGNQDLILSVILHQEADLRKARSPNWETYNITLDVMTTFDWRGSINEDCSKYSSCRQCSEQLACHWCDLSEVSKDPGSFWVGSAATTALRSGSVCGLAPVACHMLGGTSYSEKCPLEWDPTWT
eukprot:Gregarina_sp_Poly_1__1116@NODE_1273_length_4524_cov_60_548351_g83_i1_p1_GENE_NODE_1273_length_4524_cov_60_548351_g83_i1NODE_1273_length_4524_cov_60_548351_g83_i1_p1_ORF_typecomplete_len375_score16_16PSI/PF01437_25/3_2e03PSI/PF01437_25/0_0058_NODE_1273_length_4524_cov_60_548351_g83_i17431867